MTETYPTLRGIINEKSRKIEEFLVEWPFLKEPEFFLEHSSMLLGKNVQKIWIDSLSKKVKPIRQYIKFNKAAEVTRDNVPKIFVIFSLAATCTVVIERKIMIFCDDVFQGILICFLTYYVFGFCYPKEAEKTLEFIQR
ncbi:hypothetical protein PUN28_020860 [Cardiocondyla obscurior]|uniref:Uncharacterized protein n=1 Tax=Cardiocondyla obscurior TaxID=286306 RepID=A0AAW2E808_9HYME